VAALTTPAVAFSTPEREPTERFPKKAEVADAYPEENAVEEAYGIVTLLPKT
jgi:hypothetical protein